MKKTAKKRGPAATSKPAKKPAKPATKKPAPKPARRAKVKAPPADQPRDRIKGLQRVRAGDLVPHPKNWRAHPEEQRNALRGVLGQIGWADANIVRELPDGRLQILDGHLRADLDPDYQLPVLVVDLDDAEADLLLASHDALTVAAKHDADKLDDLLAGLEIGDQALADLLAQVVHDARDEPPATSPGVAVSPEGDLDAELLAAELTNTADDEGPGVDVAELPEVEIPQSFAIMVAVEDEDEQRALYDQLTAEGYRCRVLTI